MLRVKLKILVTKDSTKSNWKKGNIFNMTNNIFDPRIGLAYWNLERNFKVLKMEIEEYTPIGSEEKFMKVYKEQTTSE